MTRILSDEVLPPGMALLPGGRAGSAKREDFLWPGCQCFCPPAVLADCGLRCPRALSRERQVSIRLRVRGELLGD